MKLIHPIILLPLPFIASQTSDMLSLSRVRSEASLISPQHFGKAIQSQRSAFKRIPIKKNRAKKSQKTFKGSKAPSRIDGGQFKVKNEKIELSKANRSHLGAKSEELSKFKYGPPHYLDPSNAVLFSMYPPNWEIPSDSCLLQPKNQFTNYNHEISHQEHLENSQTFLNKPPYSCVDNEKQKPCCLFGSLITIGEEASEETEKASRIPVYCQRQV